MEVIKKNGRVVLVVALSIGTTVGIYTWLTKLVLRTVLTEENLVRLADVARLLNHQQLECKVPFHNIKNALANLEKLLQELESSRYQSDWDRDRYQLVWSVLSRLRDALADLQQFENNDYKARPATEEIARTMWSGGPSPKPGTLSILSDDSFMSAADEFISQIQDSNSISVDTENALLYCEGLKLAERHEIYFRKSRADICGCESDLDFAAKLWALRQAFDDIISNDEHRRFIIKAGRNIIGDLLRQDSKDPKTFYEVYDRLMDYMENQKNFSQIEKELQQRKVMHVNFWDVLIDFVLLDAFDDLRKPPSGVAALVKNRFLSKSMRESTLNNIIWSLLKVKRSRLQVMDGFVSHFYDLSQAVSPSLTMGILGGSSPGFEELCLDFKENVISVLHEWFNLAKMRYTTHEELTEDVCKALFDRLELIQVRLRNEVIPAEI